jgi:hypothetical protein
MTCKPLKILAAALGLLLTGAPVSAQVRAPAYGGSPSSQPAVSPYINLTLPANNPVVRYFGATTPQLGYNAAIPQLEQNQLTLATQLQAQAAQQQSSTTSALPPTGHGAGFQTQGRYFLTKGGR